MLLINFLSEEVLVWLSGWTSSDTHPMHLTLNIRTYHPNEKPHTSSARGKGIQECLELAPDSPLHSSPQPSQVCLLQKKTDHLKGEKEKADAIPSNPMQSDHYNWKNISKERHAPFHVRS